MALRQLLAGWEEIDPDRACLTVGDVLCRLAEHPTGYTATRAALLELASPKDGKTLNPRSIGQKLHHLRRRVAGGKYLDRRSRAGAGCEAEHDDAGATSGERTAHDAVPDEEVAVAVVEGQEGVCGCWRSQGGAGRGGGVQAPRRSVTA